MEEQAPVSSKRNRWLSAALKIVVTVACLWYVSGKIDLNQVGDALRRADGLFLFFAFALFVLSKLMAAYRLNIYFQNIGIPLSPTQNLKLYWLGMFYNLFLPGSISGDAYKVILLSKRFEKPYKKTAAAVLLDRFSGLAGLGLILSIYGVFVLKETWVIISVVLGIVLAVLGFFWLIRSRFRDFLPGFNSTFLLGIVVQAVQAGSVYMIMQALGIPLTETAYIFLFLVSSVASVLPLTIGGLGIREIVFLEGSKYFGLIPDVSVLISLIFYLVTLVTSAFGAIYVFRDPLKKRTQY